jgi:ankyrin repeat protein
VVLFPEKRYGDFIAAETQVRNMLRMDVKTGRYQTMIGVLLMCLLLPVAHLAHGNTTGTDDALFAAAAAGDVKAVRECTGQGASVNARSATGETPLHVAGSEEVARFLIEHGADVNARDNDFGMTPLFNQSVGVGKLLIEKGADVNARSGKGTTPLMWAVYWDAMAKAKFLIEKGADVNLADEYRKSSLHIAANWNRKELALVLLANGSNVNARDASGWTPLHWAAFEGGPEVADVLISRGADRNARTTRDRMIFPAGSTPVDVAKKARNGQMALYLTGPR